MHQYISLAYAGNGVDCNLGQAARVINGKPSEFHELAGRLKFSYFYLPQVQFIFNWTVEHAIIG